MTKYILHDLLPVEEACFSSLSKGRTVIATKKSYGRCTGCFGCWLKTPGRCVMRDGMELLGKSLLTSDEIIIISENFYGGFSVSIKRLWDRCIPGVLPFFTNRQKELHHSARYDHHPKIKVFFYNIQKMLPDEKELATKLVAANALNFMSEEYEVHFLNDLQELEGLVV